MLAIMRDNVFAKQQRGSHMKANQLIIADNTININADGMYCLNHLHKAAMDQGKATESQRPSNFAKSQEAFLNATGVALIQVRGRTGGTYAPEIVAMKYAGWIDPSYEVQVYKAVQSLKNGDIEKAVELSGSDKAKSALDEMRVAKAIGYQLDNADRIYAMLPNLCQGSRQAIAANLVNHVAGREVIPLPRIEQKFYTTTELAKDLEITATMLGRIANQHGMKRPDETGEYRMSQSNHSAKQVEQWYWSVTGAEQMRDLVKRLRSGC